MSKTNSAPTVGYLFSSQIYKWIALLFIIILLVVAAVTIREIVIVDAANSCSDDRDLRIGKYHLLLTVVNEKCEAV